MNEFDKQMIERLQNTELNTLNYISAERKNLLRLRINLLSVLNDYDNEVKEYFYNDRVSISKKIISELSITLNYLKGVSEHQKLDINYIDLLIQAYDIVYELESLIDRIQEEKKINLSNRVSNFLIKPHRLIFILEMLNAEIECYYILDDEDEEDDYLDFNEYD
ncbi:hypothetical protein [Macrococcus capreoli]|uniref:hypothetical protein n=1 Tax=Macrococcus capreoli TaxID=2982690 RepID=UPI003F434141